MGASNPSSQLQELSWIIILVIAICSETKATKLPFQEYGDVIPVNARISDPDPFWFVGDTLKLDCKLKNGIDSRDRNPFFTHRGHSDRLQTIRIENTTYRFEREVNLQSQGSYTCHKDDDVISSKTVFTDNRPKQVENVSCRIYNWQEMKCTWDLEFQNAKFVKVSANYTTYGQEERQCPQLSDTSCNWGVSDYRHAHIYYVIVKVSYVIEHQVLDSSTTTFKVLTQLYETADSTENDVDQTDWFQVQALVEPAPVTDLAGISKNETCVELSWTWNYPDLERKEKVYMLEIKADGEDIQASIQISAEESKQDRVSHNITVCDLQPYTVYQIRLSVKPYAESSPSHQQDGHTSNWTATLVQTQEGVPVGQPPMCGGCYYDIDTSASYEKGSRKVRILFKDIPEPFQHGEITGYQVTSQRLNSGERTQQNIQSVGSNAHFADVDLSPAEEEFIVTVAGETSKGVSRNASYLIVPGKRNDLPSPRRFVVEQESDDHNSTTYSLSWDPLDLSMTLGNDSSVLPTNLGKQCQMLSHYTVIWCLGNRKRTECLDGLDWAHLQPNATSCKLDVTYKDQYDLLIGLAAQVVRADCTAVSSGILWSDCIYVKNKPGKTPENIRVSMNDPDSHNVTVSWDRPHCSEKDGYIFEYLITYCLKSDVDEICKDTETNITVDGTRNEASLTGLQSKAEYLVKVFPRSKMGLGMPGRMSFLNTVPEYAKESYLVWIIIIVVIVSMVLLAGCVKLVKTYMKQKQKLKQGTLVVQGLIGDMTTTERPLPVPQPLPHSRAATTNNMKVTAQVAAGNWAVNTNSGRDRATTPNGAIPAESDTMYISSAGIKYLNDTPHDPNDEGTALLNSDEPAIVKLSNRTPHDPGDQLYKETPAGMKPLNQIPHDPDDEGTALLNGETSTGVETLNHTPHDSDEVNTRRESSTPINNYITHSPSQEGDTSSYDTCQPYHKLSEVDSLRPVKPDNIMSVDDKSNINTPTLDQNISFSPHPTVIVATIFQPNQPAPLLIEQLDPTKNNQGSKTVHSDYLDPGKVDLNSPVISEPCCDPQKEYVVVSLLSKHQNDETSKLDSNRENRENNNDPQTGGSTPVSVTPSNYLQLSGEDNVLSEVEGYQHSKPSRAEGCVQQSEDPSYRGKENLHPQSSDKGCYQPQNYYDLDDKTGSESSEIEQPYVKQADMPVFNGYVRRGEWSKDCSSLDPCLSITDSQQFTINGCFLPLKDNT